MAWPVNATYEELILRAESVSSQIVYRYVTKIRGLAELAGVIAIHAVGGFAGLAEE
jgi:hypothetical protein